MAIPSDSSLRNRLISKQLDVGKRRSDSTSESAADPSEAVQSALNSFTQSPSSADRLREHQGPLDELIKPDGIGADDSDIVESINSSASIDGSFGPKTLEALNLFQQDQVDALKLQTLANTNLRGSVDVGLQKETKAAASGLPASKDELASFLDPKAKSVEKVVKTEVKL